MRQHMPQWLQNLIDGWPMIRANLPTFSVILVLMVGAIWIVTNWSYSTVLASKSSQIELQDRQLADYREKLQGATPDQAKARIDELENRLKRVEQAGPRSLTAEQKRTLIENIRVPAGSAYSVNIMHEGGCPDCPVYAAAFERLLRDAGWRITNGMVMGPAQRPISGLALTVPDAADLSAEAAALKRGLTAANIEFEILPGGAPVPTIPPTQLLIVARGL
jgi:hypothetical protein